MYRNGTKTPSANVKRTLVKTYGFPAAALKVRKTDLNGFNVYVESDSIKLTIIERCLKSSGFQAEISETGASVLAAS